MKSILKLILIGLFILTTSCKTTDIVKSESVTVKMLRTNGNIETETFKIPTNTFVTIQRDGDKSWLVYKCENCTPHILKNNVTHSLNVKYQ